MYLAFDLVDERWMVGTIFDIIKIKDIHIIMDR